MGLKTQRALKVLLVGNYEPDRQESMVRFCELMAAGLRRRNIPFEMIRPEPFLAKFGARFSGAAKWLGYLDKFVLFPPRLKSAAGKANIVHICDHSNALYVEHLKHVAHVVTCHDLLAVRAGLGEETYCVVSPLGKLLQRAILQGLRRARMIACDSKATYADAVRLIGVRDNNIRLVPIGLNYTYKVIDQAEALQRLKAIPSLVPTVPYLIHVGSSQLRKNRDGILRIFAKLKGRFAGQVVFAGEGLTEELRLLARQLQIDDKVVEVIKPANEVLEALYGRALALIFPSRSEGFGWPIIEAQACGCPVVISNCEPCPEVAGAKALVVDIEDEDGFATSILSLQDTGLRESVVQAGFANLQFFDKEKMVDTYVQIYNEMVGTN